MVSPLVRLILSQLTLFVHPFAHPFAFVLQHLFLRLSLGCLLVSLESIHLLKAYAYYSIKFSDDFRTKSFK